MLYLLLAVVCSVLIGNLLVVFQRNHESDIRYIFLGNYLVASLISLAGCLPQGTRPSSFDWWFGSLTGILFLANFIIYRKNIAVNGLSLSVGTMRVSVLIPTLLAVVWFSESLSFLSITGGIVVLAAFTSISDTGSLRNLFWLFLLFGISGITESTLKIYNEIGSVNESAFLTVIFSAAGFSTLIWILFTKAKMHLTSLLYGFALGIPNLLSSLFFLQGLKSIPAVIAYPFYASGVVLVSILCDLLIWKQVFDKRRRMALGLLCLGVVLISLHR
jgi:multidrug transporter EmrE-like cation transporter